MSTRGFVGFKTNTKEDRKGNIFGIYNHWDSYYSQLGMQMLEFYKNTNKERFRQLFSLTEWSDDEENSLVPNVCDFLKGYCVGDDILNYPDFLNDGLFCEYGYVYNLENDTLELYRGFFDTPQNEDVSDLGSEYHTHKVYTITRDTDFDKVEDMFYNMEYSEDFNKVVDGKYVEDIFMEN